MRVIQSGTTTPPSDPDTQLWIYNALDNCITFEVYEALAPFDGGFAYDMSRMMQGPALTMMRRGVRIDFAERDRLIQELQADHLLLSSIFTRITTQGLGEAINPNSPDQLKRLFYTILRLDPIHRYDKVKRERVLTTNREALEKITRLPKGAAVLAKLLLEIRDTAKKLQVLTKGIDPDGRLRTSYSTTGTETGRWSASKNVYGLGDNLQNWSDLMRRIIIPDPGKKFIQFDLAQAESVIVAYLSGDENYKDACKSGDPHTYVCQLCWPELGWEKATTKAERRAIAESPYYRHYTYRDIAKRGGHGANYGGTPHVLAIHLKIPVKVADEFVTKYFTKFPKIRSWHNKTVQELAATRKLTTPLGRIRWFTGRPTDSTVIKEAIAYRPQSTIGDLLNLGLYNVWKELDLPGDIELLAQVHDSILFQFDPTLHNEAELIAKVTAFMRVPITIQGEECIIRSDAQSGWNWGKVKTKGEKVINPHGLRDWSGTDPRSPPPQMCQLARRVSSIYVPLK